MVIRGACFFGPEVRKKTKIQHGLQKRVTVTGTAADDCGSRVVWSSGRWLLLVVSDSEVGSQSFLKPVPWRAHNVFGNQESWVYHLRDLRAESPGVVVKHRIIVADAVR